MSESQLPLETLLAILILLFYTISAPLFEKYHFHYMHESGLCMIIGVVITIFAMIISPEHNFAQYLKFDSEIFFTFILPPIIFAAGYNLRRRSFFKYFLYIFLFGVGGTIVTFCIVCPLTYAANRYGMFRVSFGTEIESPHPIWDNSTSIADYSVPEGREHHRYLDQYEKVMEENPLNITDNPTEPPQKENKYQLNFSLREIMLFSAVIAATDTVAALTFIKEESEPKLFAILFGEGVINDAVCIVLYGIIRDFSASNEEFTAKTPLKMMGSFLNMFFFSFLVGALVGCLSSIFLKKLKSIQLNRVQECSIIVFFAFISYTLTEELGLSPIIALLFTGIFMSHYTFYNLSFQAREESSVVSRIMSNIAEAFVFTYLGLTVINNISLAFSMSFFFLELIFVIIGRVAAIFGISFLMSLCKVKSFNMKLSQKGIMSSAGSIRGAIAFGLAISIDSRNKINKEVIISSTLMLVLFSTIVFGALMPSLIKFFTSLDSKQTPGDGDEDHPYIEMDHIGSVDFGYLHPNFSSDLVGASKEKDENKLKQRLSYWLGTYWVDFDNVYMKPKLIHNWPDVKSEHDHVSKIIKNVIKDYKKASKEEKTDSQKDIKQLIQNDELDKGERSDRQVNNVEFPSRDEVRNHEMSGEPKKKKTFNRLNTEER